MNQDILFSKNSSLTSDQPMRWLITGGCGFIGRSLIKNLLAEGDHFIRIVDNLKVGTREYLAQICDFVEISPEHLSSLTSPLSPLTSNL